MSSGPGSSPARSSRPRRRAVRRRVRHRPRRPADHGGAPDPAGPRVRRDPGPGLPALTLRSSCACRVVVFLAGALLAEVFLAVVFLAVLAVPAVSSSSCSPCSPCSSCARSSTWSSSRPPRARRRTFVVSAPLGGCRLARGRLPGGRLLGGRRLGRRRRPRAAWPGRRRARPRPWPAPLALLVRLQLLGQLALGRPAILLDGTRQGLGLLGPLLQPLRLLLGRLERGPQRPELAGFLVGRRRRREPLLDHGDHGCGLLELLLPLDDSLFEQFRVVGQGRLLGWSMCHLYPARGHSNRRAHPLRRPRRSRAPSPRRPGA